MNETILKINKPYWAIVRSGDINGYHTGTANIQTSLIECETATELNEILGNGSVESGESMGDYMFKVLALSHKNLNELEDAEKEDAEREKAEAEYYKQQLEYYNKGVQ